MVRDKETAEAEKELGNKAFRSQNYDQALLHYSNAISADPKKGEYYSNRSATNLCLGRELEAIDDAQMCTKLKPKWWKGYLRLALAHLQHDRLSEMENTCRTALEVCQFDSEEGRTKLQELLVQCMMALSQRKMKDDGIRNESPRDSRLREFDEPLVKEWKKYSAGQVVENSTALLNTIKNKLTGTDKEVSIKEECRILNNIYAENDLFAKIRDNYHPTKIILDCLALYESVSDDNVTELLRLLGNSIYGCRNIGESVKGLNIPNNILDYALLESKSFSMRLYAIFAILSSMRNMDKIVTLPNYKFGPFFNMFAYIFINKDVDMTMKEFAIRNLTDLMTPLIEKDAQFLNAITVKLQIIIPHLVKMLEGYAANIETRECPSALYCIVALMYFSFHHHNLYRHGIIRAAVLYMDPTLSYTKFKEYALAIVSYSTINKTGAFRLQMELDNHYQSKVLPLLKNYRKENINVLQKAMECLLRGYCYKSFHQFLTREYCKEVTELITDIMFYLSSSSKEHSEQEASFFVYCSSVVRYFHDFDGVSFKLVLKRSPIGISLFINILKGIMKYYRHGIQSITTFIEAILYANTEILNNSATVQTLKTYINWCSQQSTPYFDFTFHTITMKQLLSGGFTEDLCSYQLKTDDAIVRNDNDLIPDSNCQNCRKKGTKICSRCENVRYCSTECQKADWIIHKHACCKEH